MYKVMIVFKYKLKILLSDKSFMLAMIIIPLLLTLITGYALKFEKENKIPVAICDLDGSNYSKTVIERILNKEGFKFIITDEKTALKMVKDFKAEAAYIIKEDFEEKLLTGDTRGIIEQVSSPSTISSELIGEIIGGEISRIILNITAADWVVNEFDNLEADALWQEAWEYTDSLWASGPAMKIDYSEIEANSNTSSGVNTNTGLNTDTNTSASSLSSSAFGMLVAFIMFLVIFNSSWLVTEKENGTLRRIISGPGAISALFTGNILSLAFIGLLQIVLFSLICTITFGVNIFSQGINILIIFLYLFSVIAISLFISSLLKTRMQLQAGAPLFSIITGFLGGCFWSFTDMGGLIKTVSLFTPQGLALDLFSKFNGTGGASSLTLLAIVLFLVSILLTYFSYLKTKNLRY